jgi:sugar phosphate isomerase/epimerase
MNRRKFVGVTMASLPIVIPQRMKAFSFGEPLAFQLHAIRALAAKDFPGTLKKMADLGYRVVELVSFRGYSANTSRDGFAPLAPMAPAAIRKTIADAGLRSEAAHFKFEEFDEDRIGQSIAWAQGVGLKRMTISDISRGTPITNRDGWKKVYERLNLLGVRLRREGLALGHHTEFDSFSKIDGTLLMDAMLAAVEPANCQYQFDMATAISRGLDAAEYLPKHAGRFFSLHLRDGKKPAEAGSYVNALPLGQGEVNWRRVLAAAQKSGVHDYVVEMNVVATEDPIAAYEASAQFLRTVKL